MHKRNLDLELEKARMVQNMLLPQAFPDLHAAELAFRFQPYYDISGDFLDYYYKKNSQELGFIICDVSGHGIPSALLAVMMKMALQLWGEYIHDPAGTMHKVRKMYNGKLDTYHVSAILGYLDLKSGRLRCVNAGHPAMLLCNPGSDQVREIKPAGSIIHEDLMHYPFEEFETILQPGDRLLLYTDGLTEASNEAGEMLDTEGLIDLYLQNKNLDVDSMCQKIMTAVHDYTLAGKLLSDDISLFAIDYKGA
ncbi:MAG: serine/threonine-protein phosphatase [Leptospiraceae bacterium]|nr:serine/threonine-protein phosphatase [Leptospiraceae bacterium]